MSVAERLLLLLSRDPAASDYSSHAAVESPDDALTRLRSSFADLESLIAGRHVLDFGCGSGYQAVAMAQAGARSVVGVDTASALLEKGRSLAESQNLRERVAFVDRLTDEHSGCFDVAVSQNSMEHFGDPEAILWAMKSALRPDGLLLITFSPPWYAPYGSHMHYFTRIPWVHLLFPEPTVMAVRSRYRHDGAARYEEVEGGLNRMSLHKFEKIISRSGLRVLRLRYVAVRGLGLLARVPGARELFVNKVDCLLR